MSFLSSFLFLSLLGMCLSELGEKCPDNASCEEDHTCCPVQSPDKFACCPLPDAVCCPGNRHCCPSGSTCSNHGCLMNVRVGQDEEYQYCPDGAACSGTTCCETAAAGEFACCPFENGVCCDDRETCCMQGQMCGGGRCLDAH